MGVVETVEAHRVDVEVSRVTHQHLSQHRLARPGRCGQEDIGPTCVARGADHLLQPRDLFLGLVKTFIFGAIVAIVGCNQGLRTSGGAAGVGKSTTAAVVTSIVLVYVADYFLAEWMFGNDAIRY